MKKIGLAWASALITLLIGFCFSVHAFYFQQRVNANNDFLSTARSMPSIYYDEIKSFNARMETIIPLYNTIGSVLLIIAGLALVVITRISLYLRPRLKTTTVASCILILLILNIPFVTALPSHNNDFGDAVKVLSTRKGPYLPYRWYGELFLLQPRNARSIGGHIYVYDNYVSTTPYSFVAFRMCLLRVETVPITEMEWLECGYFEDSTGFWIYAASNIRGEGYTENRVIGLAGEGATGGGYLDFDIERTSGPNTFGAYMFDHPGPGIWFLKEVTFTIGGDNLYLAGSESNDPKNSLNGHYSGLWYCTDNWYVWSNVDDDSDYPYYVTMSSTNNFYTHGQG